MIELLILFVLLYFTCQVLYRRIFKNNKLSLPKTCRTVIVIGSGGHTSEMINQIKVLNPHFYQPRLYIMAKTDKSSLNKIKKLEENFEKLSKTSYEVVKIPRSREVGQSYISSIFTTLHSTLNCVPIVFGFKPDLILCNGPGTCIPICLIGFLRNILLFTSTKIVFVESVCRVLTLSISGKILLYVADVIIVQWEYLHKKYPQTVFLGRLI